MNSTILGAELVGVEVLRLPSSRLAAYHWAYERYVIWMTIPPE